MENEKISHRDIESIKKRGMRASLNSEISSYAFKSIQSLELFTSINLGHSVHYDIEGDPISQVITDLNYILILIKEHTSVSFKEE